MSWATCYKTDNNIHQTFPGIMSDGRLFTDYNPNAVMNNEVRKNNNIMNNEDYRKYLTNYGTQIMSQNLQQATLDNNCSVVVNNKLMTGNNPYLYHSSVEKTQPYGYESSGLKNMYLTRQELNAQKTIQYYK